MTDTKALYGRPTEEQYAEMIAPTLAVFEEASGPVIKRVTDAIYEGLLESVQNYLRQNAEWNLCNDIRRADRISRENESLSSALEAAQAEIERLREALQWIADAAIAALRQADAGATDSSPALPDTPQQPPPA